MSLIYVIVPIEKLNFIDFNEVIEDKSSLRYNIANNEFILKFRGSTPVDLEGLAQYTNTEIRELINNPANGWIETE